MFNQKLQSLAKYGALLCILISICASGLIIIEELGFFGDKVPYKVRDITLLLLFICTLLTLGFTTMGILLHLGTITEEMQIIRYLKQEKLLTDENNTVETDH